MEESDGDRCDFWLTVVLDPSRSYEGPQEEALV